MTGWTYQLTRLGFSGAFGGASLYLMAAARRLLIGQLDWIRRGVTVNGEVVAIKQTGTVNHAIWRKYYAPTVAFTAEGERRQFTSGRSTEDAGRRFTVGQIVAVRYLPGEPDKVDLEELTGLWWPLAALLFASVVCAVIAALPFILPPPSR